MSEVSVIASSRRGNHGILAVQPGTPPCIDLGERFGHRYRVQYEPSYAAQYGAKARINDPWLKTIPCRAGHLMPWGERTLAAVTRLAGPIARKLVALPGTTVWQDGSDGVTVLFDMDHFAAVARLMHPRRRRRLSDGHRAKLLAGGAEKRFSHGSGARPDERPCIQNVLLDLEAAQADGAIFKPCGAHLSD